MIKQLLNSEYKNDRIKDFVSRGAQVIDVRSPGEFSSGHIKGSKNIPLQQLSGHVENIRKANKPVIVCCASGMRSAQAKSILESKNIEVINGGGWSGLNHVLNS